MASDTGDDEPEWAEPVALPDFLFKNWGAPLPQHGQRQTTAAAVAAVAAVAAAARPFPPVLLPPSWLFYCPPRVCEYVTVDAALLSRFWDDPAMPDSYLEIFS